MARPKGPEKGVRAAAARTCLTRAEYAALGRFARVKGTTISSLLRDVLLATMAADVSPQKGR
ncbi:unnamed protein product [Phaeothamnion confervicola]